MKVSTRYLGRSVLRPTGSQSRVIDFAPNLERDEVAFDATLANPLEFREAISALHDVVINDLRFQPRDKSNYRVWKQQQQQQEHKIAAEARQAAADEIALASRGTPSRELKRKYRSALKRYWDARRQLNTTLREQNKTLWRKLMPYDPIITVADDVVFFECFSADESSYGCLSTNLTECFNTVNDAHSGTTNVDYSWNLYNSFQTLRTYRETRFHINPEGFELETTDQDTHHEEKIELPDGWLSGLLQMQSAMGLPMRKVRLDVGCVYSILAYLKRHRAKYSPRALRFELQVGQRPSIVIEPWGQRIEISTDRNSEPTSQPVRIWGRRRLLCLSRLLPLADSVDVYLSGTGLPSFWVVNMGSMKFTLGLSGWTTNDWTRNSAIHSLLPQTLPSDRLTENAAEELQRIGSCSLEGLSQRLTADIGETAAAMSQLALRGQAIFDLPNGIYRWRQILPVAASAREIGAVHPETAAARNLVQEHRVVIHSRRDAPRDGLIVTGQVENQTCEVLVDTDGFISKGKCRCSWHYKYGIRNGACRHLQAIRDGAMDAGMVESDDWYQKLLRRAGAT